MSVPEIYDALAPHYREYAATRSAYLDAVDQYVALRIPTGASSLLDVGAGDGIRAMGIARRRDIGTVFLCEPSAELARKCRKLPATEVWETTAESIPETRMRFDVITSLWNVLGHMQNRAERLRALNRLRTLLKPAGRIFLDLNNRHNAAAYGWPRVLGRLVLDALAPDERRGDASYLWEIEGRAIPAMGHLFTPAEARLLFDKSGLRVVERAAIDYANGRISQWPLLGQLVFVLTDAETERTP